MQQFKAKKYLAGEQQRFEALDQRLTRQHQEAADQAALGRRQNRLSAVLSKAAFDQGQDWLHKIHLPKNESLHCTGESRLWEKISNYNYHTTYAVQRLKDHRKNRLHDLRPSSRFKLLKICRKLSD